MRDGSEGRGGWGETCFGGFGDAVAEDFDFDVTDGGMEGDGHGRRALPSSQHIMHVNPVSVLGINRRLTVASLEIPH